MHGEALLVNIKIESHEFLTRHFKYLLIFIFINF
jgi:hypothetical protein